MFVGAGFNAFGIASGGGAGWVLAEWVATGEAPHGPLGRRHPPLLRPAHATATGSASARSRPMASTTPIGFPHEEYESGRPRIVSPLYERLKAHGAVFGSKLGWERPNWFAPTGVEPQRHLFHGPAELVRRGRRGAPRTCASAVGLFDQSSFAKYELTRPGCRRRRSTGSAPTTSPSRRAGSPTRRCSTRAAASSAT